MQGGWDQCDRKSIGLRDDLAVTHSSSIELDDAIFLAGLHQALGLIRKRTVQLLDGLAKHSLVASHQRGICRAVAAILSCATLYMENHMFNSGVHK
mgnify:CR=1 FL=1